VAIYCWVPLVATEAVSGVTLIVLQDDSISHRNCDRRRNAIGGGSLDGGRTVRYASYNALRGNGSNRRVIGEPSHRGRDVFRAVVVYVPLATR